MKTLLTACLLACTSILFAQKKVEKTIPVQRGQKLVLNFDYPELIKIQTWDKQEILITGTASINRGENDDAFELQVTNTPNELTVVSHIRDKENLPQRIVIKHGEQEVYFKAKDWNDPEVQKFMEENGRQFNYMSNGVIMDIELEIFIPKGMETRVEAKYGLVEIKKFEASLVVEAKYGGVDATITPASYTELKARTHYGEILTNLNIKFDSGWDGEHRYPKWTEISAKGTSGPNYFFESKYGKVYLRKPI